MSFSLSYTPHGSFSATEARALVTHKGSLYCATGQWCETDPVGPPQIIRLDSAGGDWQLEAEFPPDPVERIAVACMAELSFPTAKLTTLIAGFFGGSAVALKNGGGEWVVTRIGQPGGMEIRSFIAHRDYVTGVDMAFAGQTPQGIYSGVYDSDLPGEIQWATTPELDTTHFPPMNGNHPERVMAMAELNGVLYATVGQKIYRRNDGHPSSWTLMWTNPQPGMSNSGLRGLTAINGDLWVGVEGTASRILKINAQSWEETTLIDLSGPHNYYIIPAYNNMVPVNVGGAQAVMFGIDAAETSPAHYYYFLNGIWAKVTIPAVAPKTMVSTRSICVSPFNSDELYFSGYDANSKPCRNTAWVVTSSIEGAIA